MAEIPPIYRRRILISGANGLIGSAAIKSLSAAGATVDRLVRRPINSASASKNSSQEIIWDFASPLRTLGTAAPDAIIHLAGEPIASGYWTSARKERLRESRIASTAYISEAIARSFSANREKPAVMIVASGVGIYGDRGDELLTEDSHAGTGFLAILARDWEAAADPARQAGVRVVHLRLGVVLAKNGGALAKMLPAFRIGLGARLGDGRQWTSWIALDDVVRAIEFILTHPDISGPVNLVAPGTVTNAEFTRELAVALHAKARLRVPAFVLAAAGGDMAREVLLASQRVIPQRLTNASFAFHLPRLNDALKASV